MVAGNDVLTAASTYMVEDLPAGGGSTHVTGIATPGGATARAQFPPGCYVEKRYTTLATDGGVSGALADRDHFDSFDPEPVIGSP